MLKYQLFINGQFVDNGDRAMIPVINPATEEVLFEIPSATACDVDAAVRAAEKAQIAWAKLPAIERAGYLRKIAALIRENSDTLIRTLASEQGKTWELSTVEIFFTADYMDFMAEYARRYEGEIIQSDRVNEQLFLHKLPIGVAAGILPWNFPFFLIARKMAPALVTGNTIVVKPSTETPGNAFEFARLVKQAGLPDGVFNLVSGSGGVVGTALAGHPKVGIVSMTGSVEVGIKVMEAAARNVTKVSLELGGKAPAIIMADADLDLAAKSVFDSRVINSGQVCNCAERVYVQESVADAFIEKVTALMRGTKYGNPLTERGLDMGPMVSKAQLDNVQKAVDHAIEQGAKCILGGHRAKTEKGFYFEPTVLLGKHEMDCFHQEIFGPVLPITTFKDFDEALELANDCEYGLTSSLFTNDYNLIMRANKELKFGETYINREHFECMQGFHAGWRKSGIGGADGKHGLEEYLQTHVMYVSYDDKKK